MLSQSVMITLLYLLLFQILTVMMKLVSLYQNDWPDGWILFLFLAPVPSFRTWERSVDQTLPERIQDITILITELLALLGYYSLSSSLFGVENFHWFLQGYLTIVPFVVLVDALGRLCRISYRLIGFTVPHIHGNFFKAQSLADFWSTWNIWFADFLKESCFRPLRHVPRVGLFTAFFVSGLLHEYLINLPLFLIYGTNLFGTMLIYFLIQALGMVAERVWFRRVPMVNRIWTWWMVLLPAPLVLNEGTLRVFHFGFFQ